MRNIINNNTTFKQSYFGEYTDYDYQRANHPNARYLEERLCELCDSEYATVFSSGCSAIHAILTHKDDAPIIIGTVYGGTQRLIDLFQKDNTGKYLFGESIMNPTIEPNPHINYLNVVDTTLDTPWSCSDKPIRIISLSKLIGGAHNTIGGVVLTSDSDVDESLKYIRKTMGTMLPPESCNNIVGGVDTYHARLSRIEENTKRLVSNIPIEYIVGSHPTGLVSIRLENMISRSIASRFKCLKIAESMGGVLHTINHPYSMTHAYMRDHYDYDDDTLYRVSIGLESVSGLIEDISMIIESDQRASCDNRSSLTQPFLGGP